MRSVWSRLALLGLGLPVASPQTFAHDPWADSYADHVRALRTQVDRSHDPQGGVSAGERILREEHPYRALAKEMGLGSHRQARARSGGAPRGRRRAASRREGDLERGEGEKPPQEAVPLPKGGAAEQTTMAP